MERKRDIGRCANAQNKHVTVRRARDTINTSENNFHIIFQRITLTNKLKQCSLTMNKIAYIALNKTLKYNLTVTFSSTFQ